MALYVTNFKRLNFSFGDDQVIEQSVDIIFEYDGEITDDMSDEEWETVIEKSYAELYEQIPFWGVDSKPPKYCKNGWSSVLSSKEYKKINS